MPYMWVFVHLSVLAVYINYFLHLARACFKKKKKKYTLTEQFISPQLFTVTVTTNTSCNHLMNLKLMKMKVTSCSYAITMKLMKVKVIVTTNC